MDCETFNWLPALKQVRGVFGAPQTSTIEVSAKLVSSVNLKLLIVLTKSSILDAGLGSEFTSTGGYIIIQFLKFKQRRLPDNK